MANNFSAVHPGEILLEEFMRPLGISQYRLAKDTSVPPRRINEIVLGQRSITANTALRLARFFGTSDMFWLNPEASATPVTPARRPALASPEGVSRRPMPAPGFSVTSREIRARARARARVPLLRRGLECRGSMSGAAPTDDVPQLLAMGIAATERGEYEAGLTLLRRVYQIVPPEKAPQGLSSYGLCVAKADKKNKAGAELAQKAIRLESYEGRHWANLIRIYIAAKNRRKAVEVLEDALRRLKKDRALILVRDEIGYRRAPYFRFLHRQNPLNKLYSQAATKVQGKGRPAFFMVAGVIYVILLTWLFVLILR